MYERGGYKETGNIKDDCPIMLSIQEVNIPYFCLMWQQTVANSVNVTVVYIQT